MDSIIQTARFRLRPHRVEDLDRYVPLWSSPESSDPQGLLLLTPEDVWARLLRHIGHWSHFGYGLFVAEKPDTGELIGEVGIAHFNRNVDPRFDSAPEAAWRVSPSVRGQGIASQAMLAIHEWFDRTYGAPRTVCMINPDNAPSLKVAARLGYRAFGHGVHKTSPVMLLERLSAHHPLAIAALSPSI